MFYKNISVKRPENTVVYPHNNYVYYTAKKVYIKDKQYNQNKRVLIGRMTSDGIHMNPNDHAREFFPEWFDSMGITPFFDYINIGNSIIIDHIMDSLGISSMLDSYFGDNANLIKDIVQYMVIGETTTIQHFSSFMKKTPIYSDKIYSDSTISRLFKEGITYRQIDEFLSAWNKIHTFDSIYLSYDSTNYNTNSEGIEIAEFGHPKIDEDLPIINMSLAADQATGTPLFYEIYPGSIIDNSQLEYAVELSKKYGYDNIGIILDRGCFSVKNLRDIDAAGHDVIMMVKTNQSKVRENILKYSLSVKDSFETYIEEYEVYGLTVKAKLTERKNDKEYYMHIYYDGERANDERVALLNRAKRLEKELQERVDTTKLNRRENMKRYESDYKLYYDDNGYLKRYTRDEEKLKEKINVAGYFVLITSKKMEAYEALSIYRNRDVVEKLFRAIKTGLDYDKVGVHSDRSLEGKSFVVFLACIIRNEMFQKTKILKQKSKKAYTVPAIIEEMEGVYIIRDSKNKYIMRYGLTAKQKLILNQFGIDEKEVKQYIMDLNDRIV